MAQVSGAQFRWGKANKGFAEALLDAGKTVTKKAAEFLGEGCLEFLKSLDWEWPRGKNNGPYASGFRGGDTDHPWFTGTLHDSVAASIIDGTRILRLYQMEPGARENQKNYRTGEIYIGTELGLQAAMRAAHTFGNGIGGLRAVLTIGAPYTAKVNQSDEHFDFISPMEQDLVAEVSSKLEDLKKVQIVDKKKRR